MALTFEQLIGAGGTMAPRGAEAGEPTPTELKTTPTRPLWGSTPLARLSAPTLGQRLGEMLTKTTRAKYEERWAAVEQELAMAYETDSARLTAIQGERERLLKHLQGLDKELQEIAVAKAKGWSDGVNTALAAMYGHEVDLATAQGRLAFDVNTKRNEKEAEVLSKYELSSEQARTVQEIGALMGDWDNSNIADLLETQRAQLQNVSATGATPEQRREMATRLYELVISRNPGVSAAVAERAVSRVTGIAQQDVNRAALKEDQEAVIAREEAKVRGGIATPTKPGLNPEERERDTANRNKAEEVNAWARSPEGQAVLAALGDDGNIDDEEAAQIAEARMEANKEEASKLAKRATEIGTVDAAMQEEFNRLTATVLPARMKREALTTARQYGVLASTPGVGDLVSTDVRRTLDPRRLETLAELSALGEEEDALRAGMVAPTYRNIAAGVQRERVEARDTRRAISGMKQEAREVGQAAAQDERRIQRVMGDISPQGVREARKAGKAGVMGTTTGLDPNATPEQRRFAQAMARAVQAGAWQERDTLPKSADAMYKLYEKGMLRDPTEAVRKAIELSPDDPDAVLVPYLRRVNRLRQDRDAIPPIDL